MGRCRPYTRGVQFRLVYEGRLPSNGTIAQKQAIRRALQPQIRELWQHEPLDSRSAWYADEPVEGEYNILQRVGAFKFAPLVSRTISLVAELNVVMLKPGAPGGAVQRGGDIDNRLKTLLDALRCPHSAQELPEADAPGAEEDPFFCLLEDDDLITDLGVTVDRYLAAPDPRNVNVAIFVRTRVTRVTWGNLALS